MNANRKKQLSGFSLVEVLIALVILSVGLLGLAGLQTSSLRAGTDGYLRSQASILAYNMIDRMRANETAVKADDYQSTSEDTNAKPATLCGTNTCSPSALANWDLWQWYETVANGEKLPDASASIDTTAEGTHTKVIITIAWLEKHVEQGASGESTEITVTTLL